MGSYCQTGKDLVRVILDAMAKAKAENSSDESEVATQALRTFNEHAKACAACASHYPLMELQEDADFPRPASVNRPQK